MSLIAVTTIIVLERVRNILGSKKRSSAKKGYLPHRGFQLQQSASANEHDLPCANDVIFLSPQEKLDLLYMYFLSS